LPKPMHRSRSFRRLDRVTPKGRHVIHYERRKPRMPHCAICGAELQGISRARNPKGKSRRTTARIFGGVLCSGCTGEVIKLASRIENGEMKLNDISMKQKNYVLQMIAH
jgi:large subunit ribosomal protein L34e